MPTIYYIRHGQTDWNAELRFQGQKDIALNDAGRKQARDNGLKLAGLLGRADGIDFVASPLGRARETMEIVRGAMGLDPALYRMDDRLIEASYGDLEGTTLPELKQRFPQAHRGRKLARWSYLPPAGESHQMVLDRVIPFLDGISRDTVIVAHGVVGRVVRWRLFGGDRDAAAGYAFPQDKVLVWRDGTETLV